MLNKHEFLKTLEVEQFINFLNNDFFNSGNELQKLLDKYKWPDNKKGLNFEETFEKVTKWRNDLKSALNDRNENMAYSICCEILKWGGSGVSWRNLDRLSKHKSQGILLNNLIKIKDLIINPIIDINSFDLNMNSGFSKIYTLLDDNFIIYDSRVAAKIGSLVKECFKKTIIPSTLRFGKCEHLAKKSNRNPGKEFPILTGKPKKYFESNIKTAWILEQLALKNNLMDNPKDRMIFAFQTALFVAGKDLDL